MVGGVDGDHGVLVIKRQESVKNQDSATVEMEDQAVLAQVRIGKNALVCLISNTLI